MPARPKIGSRWGRWLVLSQLQVKHGEHLAFACRCSCGKEQRVDGRSLVLNLSKSCGCWQKEVVRSLSRTHGMTGSPEYQAYSRAKTRCTNPETRNYKDYGGRGIKFLFTSFEQFLEHIGSRPSDKHSIDRYPSNDGHYEIGNVRWATDSEQNKNKRKQVAIQNWTDEELMNEVWRRTPEYGVEAAC